MLRSLRDPVVNAASFGLQHTKAESCVRRGDGARRWGRDSPFSWTVPRRWRISAQTGLKSSPRCFLREARSTRRTNRAWIPRRGRIVAAPRAIDRAQTPCSGRGPFGDRPDSEPQRRSSERTPRRARQTLPGRDPPLRSRPFRRPRPLGAAAAQHHAKTHPQRRSTTRRPTRSDAAPREDPPTAAQHHAKTHPQRRSSERTPGAGPAWTLVPWTSCCSP